LRDEKAGVSGGFKYEQKQNSKGEQVGGIVPHITRKSIANNEPPDEEVLVDRPNEIKSIVPVSGPFVVETTIPTPFEMEGAAPSAPDPTQRVPPVDGAERMLEALRRSPVLRLPNNQTVTFYPRHIANNHGIIRLAENCVWTALMLNWVRGARLC